MGEKQSGEVKKFNITEDSDIVQAAIMGARKKAEATGKSAEEILIEEREESLRRHADQDGDLSIDSAPVVSAEIWQQIYNKALKVIKKKK